MTHHYDYADKTKGERRERGEEKAHERMSQGKRAKLLHTIIMNKAAEAEKAKEERDSNPRR